jgi:hypothetical protein
MILTPIPEAALPATLDCLRLSLRDGLPRQVFSRIARLADATRATGASAALHRRQAIALADALDIAVRPGSPALDFSWNGEALRGDTEAYVLLHEVAHFQLAAPARRHVIDFGLGAGPETGDRAAADGAARLFGVAREHEEAMASLLGITWEIELGQPALASFLDQNWLEGAGPGAVRHFETILTALRSGGFIDDEGCPTRHRRTQPDATRDPYSFTAPVRLET